MSHSKYILDCLYGGDYRLTLHARKRMAERNVTFADIKSCAATGSVKKSRGEKYKVVGQDLDGEELTLICAIEKNVLVITAY